MWRSVLLHEFVDHEIANFHALAGSASPASLGLSLSKDPGQRHFAAQIKPGLGFTYGLAEPLDRVVGVSGRLRVRYPVQAVTAPVTLMDVGVDVGFRIQPQPNPAVGGEPASLAHGLLRVGPTEVDLGVVRLPHRRYVDLRFDWHTSGQARLVLNRRLVGYHHAVAPGAELDVNGVGFGLAGLPPTATNPRYQVGRVFVRAMRRSDSLARLTALLPTVSPPDTELAERCQLRAMLDLLAIVDRLRSFMTMANEKLTQPWSDEAGPPEGAFSAEASAAHELALTAVVEFVRMLRTGDFSAPEPFLDAFGEFLGILREALPDEFEALAADLMDLPDPPPECVELAEAAREQHGATIGPLLELLEAAAARLQDVLGGS